MIPLNLADFKKDKTMKSPVAVREKWRSQQQFNVDIRPLLEYIDSE